MGNAQLNQVVNTSSPTLCGLGAMFGPLYKLTLVLHARSRVDRHVAVVHLINDCVFCTCKCRAYILIPSFWISSREVNYRCTATIDTNCLGKDTWGLVQCPARTRLYDLESIELTIEVAFNSLGPTAIFLTAHGQGLQGFCSSSIRIQVQIYGVCVRAPY